MNPTTHTASSTPAATAPANLADRTHGLALIDELLRDRDALLKRIERGRDLTELARAMIVTIAVCAGAFGAATGVFRGGVQILFAAVKLPLAVLLTAAVCAPVLTTLNRVVRAEADLRKDLALILSCMGLGSLVVAATTPAVLLAYSFDADYHKLALVILGCGALGGLTSVSLFAKSLSPKIEPDRMKRLLVGVPVIISFALVGSQMAWTLRPYLVRPRTPDTPFVRSLEGSLVDAVVTTIDSAQGKYEGIAPLPSKRARHESR